MRITELLLEYDRAITLQKFSSAIEPIAMQGNLTAEQVIEALEQMDPTATKQYVPWLAKQFIAKQFRIEDTSQVKELLTNFTKLKPRLPVEQRDLGRFDFNKLSEIVNSAMNPEVGSTTDNKNSNNAGTFPVVSNSKVLYNGPYGQLSIPETEEASCELGRGTKWCTSASKDNMFAAFSEISPLYVWRDRDGSKWQFHFNLEDYDYNEDSNYFQFMDARNDPIDDQKLKFFRTQHPVLKKLFKQEEKVITQNSETAAGYARDVVKGRWPEGELVIAKDPNTALQYARDVVKGRWLEGEPAIAQDPDAALQYARETIKGRWPEGEKVIAQDPKLAVIYAQQAIKGRWREKEQAIARDPSAAVSYAQRVIKGRWPEQEQAIAQDPNTALHYVRNVIKGRWPEGEKAIAQDPNTAMIYAQDVIEDRWPEGEKIIAQNPRIAASYAKNVIGGRWPEAEHEIAQDPHAATTYAQFVIKGRWPEGEPAIAKDPMLYNIYNSFINFYKTSN